MYDTLQELLGGMAVVLSDIDGFVGEANHEAHAWAAAADAELIRLLGLVIKQEAIHENE